MEVEVERLRAENARLRAVLKAAGVTGWTYDPDGGNVEPHYDTDEEEDAQDGALLGGEGGKDE